MTVRSGSTAAKRRGCNGLTGIHMSQTGGRKQQQAEGHKAEVLAKLVGKGSHFFPPRGSLKPEKTGTP